MAVENPTPTNQSHVHVRHAGETHSRIQATAVERSSRDHLVQSDQSQSEREVRSANRDDRWKGQIRLVVHQIRTDGDE